MDKTIKIIHVDPDFRVTYIINHDGVLISSHLSLEQAISMLKTENLDLILSEPHQKAILNPQEHPKQRNLNSFDDQLNFKKEDFRYGQNEESGNV